MLLLNAVQYQFAGRASFVLGIRQRALQVRSVDLRALSESCLDKC